MQVFRRMTVGDIAAVAALEQLIFSDAWSEAGIRETFCQSQAFVMIAEEAGNIIGYCIVYYVLDEGEIARVAVSPEKRRKGIARGLLDCTCRECKEKGVERLLLDVRESNVSARRLYEDYGFCVDGIRKNFYQNPTEDAVLMSMVIGYSSH